MTKGASQVSIGMVDIKCLTDNELQQQLINHGYNPGPIIPSTRQVYEDKLQELITQHKAKKKSEELNKDLECVGDKENLDDHILERAITTSSRRSKQCKKDSCALEKPAKQKSFELQQCASPLLQRGRKLSSDYTSDGDVDIFYADPCSHTGIRLTDGIKDNPLSNRKGGMQELAPRIQHTSQRRTRMPKLASLPFRLHTKYWIREGVP
ncbi:LEM domain-containing protein 1 isoform X3 [Sminthopsis crassicaudata]|uniref:LEM domain-containing protein 1 isoform X3 n=1 Tax=Sminthopsis crassicaudata TaxID=9301 RepID=UPI003D68F5A1